MLTERQLLILKLIFQLYTETLEPVGSKTLMQYADLPFSSATIRNEMMKLEEMGYLEKNHTSSGRIPSKKGYRFFLDYILPFQQQNISKKEKQTIRSTLQNPVAELQELFHMSADILSALTNYTCISLGPELSHSHLTGFRLVRLRPTQVMAILVTDKGYVENKVFTIPQTIAEDDLERIVKVINEELIGLPLMQVIQRLQTDIPLLINRYVQTQIHIINALQEMIHKFDEDRIHVAGKRHLLNFVDSHSNIEQLKHIYQLMDDPEILHQLVKTETPEVHIRLGYEMSNPYLQDFSLITATYELPNKDRGFIALLGPVNMPYSKVLSIVKGLREELTRSMSYYIEHDEEQRR